MAEPHRPPAAPQSPLQRGRRRAAGAPTGRPLRHYSSRSERPPERRFSPACQRIRPDCVTVAEGMVGCEVPAGWVVDWLVWLVGWLRLAGWLTERLVGSDWSVGYSVGWLVLVGSLAYWLIQVFGCLVSWLGGWSNAAKVGNEQKYVHFCAFEGVDPPKAVRLLQLIPGDDAPRRRSICANASVRQIASS